MCYVCPRCPDWPFDSASPETSDYRTNNHLLNAIDHQSSTTFEPPTLSVLVFTMSRYPPPPSFGVPFNPNAQFAPSQNAPYPNVSNYLFYQSSDPSHQGRAHQALSFANNHAFNATSQNINVPTSRPGIPQIPYSGFGQTTSGSFPPPSYPSIQPLPYSSFLHPHLPPPPLFQRETHAASLQTHVSLPSKPPAATSPLAQGITKETPISTATITELEDGELSDRDGGRGSRGPRNPATSNEPRPPVHECETISRRASMQGVEKNIGAQAVSHSTTDEGIQHDMSYHQDSQLIAVNQAGTLIYQSVP